MLSRFRKKQIMQFRTCSVDFLGSRHSCPNGSATNFLIPLQFSTKYAQCAFFVVNICILRPSPLSSRQPPGRPHAQPSQRVSQPEVSTSLRNHCRKCKRSFQQEHAANRPFPRLHPAAAAEWAKPREIRRGTRSSAAYAGRRTACQITFKPGYSGPREAYTRSSPPASPKHRKSSAKIAHSGTTCVISRGPTVRRRCNPPPAAGRISS